VSVEQINRLGFPAWADNLIVDFIESHPEMVVNHGTHTVEKPDGTAIRAVYGDGKATIVVRGYTGSGWETHEQSVVLCR